MASFNIHLTTNLPTTASLELESSNASYDENMMEQLKQHAASLGNPLWGLAGPHDAPDSNELSGSWQSPYGDFFLSWYYNQLHALTPWPRMSSQTTRTGKMHTPRCLLKTRSCGMIVSGIGRSATRPANSSPEMLLKQIQAACKKHGVGVSGMNSGLRLNGFDRIRMNVVGDANNVVDLFNLLTREWERSSSRRSIFTQFARGLNEPFAGLDSDDLPTEETLPVEASVPSNAEMQTA
ncbi:unnamed protein product [Linum tenue]|uniref:Beta-amylase n=1 Tax=Linum tenue TaxID=586396 RepID=A0AAV0RUI8_9ROSI|nr:unnamed protein product [Linum tenue]